MSKAANRSSLRSKLTSRLVLWQTATLLMLAGGIVVLEFFTDEAPLGRLDPDLTSILAEALETSPSGLVMGKTEELSAVRADSPGLWFVIKDESGRQISEGTPPQFAGLSSVLSQLSEVEIRGDATGASSAVMDIQASSAGQVRVLAGGAKPPGIVHSFAEFAATQVLPIVLLILAVLCAMTFIAMPQIIGSAISGLQRAAERASHINIKMRGTRLPTTDLPTEVAILVEAVNAALERLDEGYARQERFIADAAHELRTPIAILQNRIELVGTEDGHRLLLDVQRLANLAEQLLDLQRLDSQDTAFGTVNLVSICRQVIADLAPMAISSGYEPVFDAESETICVQADASSIERAVINLFQNAIAHGGGHGTIHIKVLSTFRIEVSDDGPGIPDDRRDWILEPFHRLKPMDQGSGLGLSLVREIMRRHGGSVGIGASESGGACFTLSFPEMANPPARRLTTS